MGYARAPSTEATTCSTIIMTTIIPPQHAGLGGLRITPTLKRNGLATATFKMKSTCAL
ncbi:hypothetical protein PPTG_07674 [Phytophthora nicotianae INRA-310]|uniref:Uncharacterized protein n=1 Tax=Phytophthora nicotianae (strain INRA-310) TaxID=761204 RepID=W2QNG8_PHYN3|nr:hypothetical protein PPTG_07674 [Phytophthora nicotianae INRA-310]ETN14673.1 hypothetical protein PPTG_07674 [Phytophthora nicotianae INRA-310]